MPFLRGTRRPRAICLSRRRNDTEAKSVKVVVLSSPEDVGVTVQLLETLALVGVPAYGLKIRDSWEHAPRGELSARVKPASHILVVASPESAGKSWFSYAAGYAAGRGGRVALYRVAAHWDPPSYLASLPIIDGLDELATFFRIEKAEWMVEEERRNARASLLELGISFHADSLAGCARDGDLRAVELFLKAGFPADSRDKHGVPLLCLAARGRHFQVVRLLVETGASLDLQSEDRGYSALMDASLGGAVDIVEYLLAKGADPDVRSKDGQTALVVAVGKGDVEVARRLLEYGADPELADKLGMSARGYAKLFKKPEMLALFKLA